MKSEHLQSILLAHWPTFYGISCTDYWPGSSHGLFLACCHEAVTVRGVTPWTSKTITVSTTYWYPEYGMNGKITPPLRQRRVWAHLFHMAVGRGVNNAWRWRGGQCCVQLYRWRITGRTLSYTPHFLLPIRELSQQVMYQTHLDLLCMQHHGFLLHVP